VIILSRAFCSVQPGDSIVCRSLTEWFDSDSLSMICQTFSSMPLGIHFSLSAPAAALSTKSGDRRRSATTMVYAWGWNVIESEELVGKFGEIVWEMFKVGLRWRTGRNIWDFASLNFLHEWAMIENFCWDKRTNQRSCRVGRICEANDDEKRMTRFFEKFGKSTFSIQEVENVGRHIFPVDAFNSCVETTVCAHDRIWRKMWSEIRPIHLWSIMKGISGFFIFSDREESIPCLLDLDRRFRTNRSQFEYIGAVNLITCPSKRGMHYKRFESQAI
jgi:hypothetical protein